MKNNGWANALFTLVFIAVPFIALAFFVFQLEAFADYKWVALSSGLFLIYALALSFLVVVLKIIHINSLLFNIPISIVFVILLFTYDAAWYVIVPLSLLGILTAIPTNIYVTKFKESRRS